LSPAAFIQEVAPARTFVLHRDVEPLRAAGLIKGGSLQNALVVKDGELLNPEPLRFPNEFVRHKILDLCGDLALLGRPLLAHVVALRGGHETHVAFVKELARSITQNGKPTSWVREPLTAANKPEPHDSERDGFVFDLTDILRIMPHRYPMLLVDRIIEMSPERIVGIKNVTINEPFFQGHFPGQPIMPGVLLIEAMAQVGGVMLLNTVEDPEGKLVYFLGIDNARFRQAVVPGDQVTFVLEPKRMSGKLCKMHGRAYVGKRLVAEAELMSTVVDPS
jgi:UDP-3-O-[3-hydroxymyristoyl] N-acetylglucosamine deacetylase/3-hydroxyacyl-[acyl-carrier-protein] dehydratase